MHDTIGNRGVIPASTLLIAAMVVGGIYLSEPTLTTLRPKEPEAFKYSFLESEAIQIPAWEDPWVAINKERRALLGFDNHNVAAEYSILNELRKDVLQRIWPLLQSEQEGETNRPRSLLPRLEVMVVTTMAGGQHSAIETRRRQRYALMAAMAATGYHQDSPRNVGHLVVPNLFFDERPSGQTGGIQAAVRPGFGSIAYDWFHRVSERETADDSDGLPGHVLVLWVQSDMLQRHAIPKLATLLSGILRPSFGPAATLEGITLLGPDDSLLLQKMLSEGQALADDVADIQKACAKQTMPPADNHLLRLDRVAAPAVRWRRDRNRSTDPPWTQWSATDEQPSVATGANEECSASNWVESAILPLSAAQEFSLRDAAILNTTIQFAHLYLDEGLSQQAADKLRDCAEQKRGDAPSATALDLFDCLNDLPVSDSDPAWAEQVWSFSQLFMPTLEERVSTIQRFSEECGIASVDRSKMAWTAFVVDDYLDDGLPLEDADWQAETLECAQGTKERGITACSAEALMHCIQPSRQPAITDSDDNWHATVAGLLQMDSCDDPNSLSPAQASLSTQDRKRYADLPTYCDVSDLMAKFSVWSPRATVPLSYLVQNPPASRDGMNRWESAIADALNVHGFRSMIADDHKIMREIVNELSLRGVDLCAAGDAGPTVDTPEVAILVDSTSYYGAEVDRILDAVCGKGRKANIRYWGYVQRVDGATDPGSADENKSARPFTSPYLLSDPSLVALPQTRRELSAGPHQLDYARRLGDIVSPTRVVGVLGPDIYDKLLIFQAIRGSAPGTLLFTTDLDAAYSHPSAREWAANLVIGSAFALEPPERDRRSTEARISAPPFRDSYQTAFYRATRAALRRHDGGQKRKMQRVANPVLYEVGRRGFVDISTKPALRSPPSHTHQRTMDVAFLTRLSLLNIGYGYFWPDQGDHFGWTATHKAFGVNFWLKLAFLLLPLMLMIARTAAICREARQRVSLRGQVAADSDRSPDPVLDAYRDEYRWARRCTVLLGFALLVLLAVMLTSHTPGKEPFLLFDGISGIPTLVLWTSVSVLSICFVVIGHVKFESSNCELTEYFRLQRGRRHKMRRPNWNKAVARIKHYATMQSPDWWPYLRDRIKRLMQYRIANWAATVRVATAPMHTLRPHPTGLASADEVWRSYQRLGAAKVRLGRGLFVATMWFVLVYLILVQNPAQPLVRGGEPLMEWIRMVTIMGVLLVIAMAGDAMKLCRIFVQAISLDPLQWRHAPETKLAQGLDRYVANRVASMEIIARRTETVGGVVFYPFLLIGLLLIARSSLFEGWVLDGYLILVYGFFVLYLFVRMVGLQREADAARARIISNLRRFQHEIRMEVASGIPKSQLAKRARDLGGDEIDQDIERLIDYVESIQKGAFQPVLQHPMFRAIAWPSTGVGLIALVQMLL